MTITMVTINTRGIQGKDKFKYLLLACNTWYSTKRVSIICIQEHNMNPNMDNNIMNIANNYGWTPFISYASARTDNIHWGGSGILVHHSISHHCTPILLAKPPFISDLDGSMTIIQLCLPNYHTDIKIASIYVPQEYDNSRIPIDRYTMINRLPAHIDENMIIGGDYNHR